MKIYIRNLLLFFGAPLIILVALYIITDPFRNLGAFDLNDFSEVNREYVSMELFLKNNNTQNYNAFVLGSSRACGINTYYWKSKLNDSTANQFLFQAWAETITGIYQKINFLDSNGNHIKHALVLIDIPSTFIDEQEATEALKIKDHRLSEKPFLYNQLLFFKAYLKPDFVISSFYKTTSVPTFDTISNDWIGSNKDTWHVYPEQNFNLSKDNFPKTIPKIEHELISKELKEILIRINTIFDKHNTDFKILISPSYSQIEVNPNDLNTLINIFGENRIFDFSGKNEISIDKYNFSDPGHFDWVAGKKMLDIIY